MSMSAAAANKLALQFLKPAPIKVGARPVMIFGMGSHTYPNSRSSVGYFLVNILGKRLGTPFHRFSDCNAYVAHFEAENLLLVQPDTYFVSENHQCMRRIVSHYPVEPKKSVLIYHEPTLPLGAVEYMTKGRTEQNSELHALAQELKTEEFPRIAVGIQYPNASSRFDPPVIHQLQSTKEVVPKVFAAIDTAVGKIREEYPLSDVDEENPLRPENTVESSDITSSQEVYVGPRDPSPKTLDAAMQKERLWEIRRQREKDPEFKRLMAVGGRK